MVKKFASKKMRWLKRTVRCLVLVICFTSLYLVSLLQNQNWMIVTITSAQQQDNLLFRPQDFLQKSASEVNLKTLTASNFDNQLLDIRDFHYIKNASRQCSAQDDAPYLVAFIHSAPSNFAKRTVIRETWASPYTLLRLRARVVFVIGLSNDTRLQDSLDKESADYGDLVQANFVDTYKNLTYKHLTGFKWLLNFCNASKFVMKADDDAFVDIYRVVQMLRETFDTTSARPHSLLACSVFPNGTPARREGKWALTLEEYPFPAYPPYCSGVAYFLTPDLVMDLYETASKVKYLTWIDDLFVTGIVAAALKVRHQPLNFKYTYDPQRLRQWLERRDLKPSPFIVGDIGETHDWEKLMVSLWRKTRRVWR